MFEIADYTYVLVVGAVYFIILGLFNLKKNRTD